MRLENHEILLKHILIVFGGKLGRKFYLLRILVSSPFPL